MDRRETPSVPATEPPCYEPPRAEELDAEHGPTVAGAMLIPISDLQAE